MKRKHLLNLSILIISTILFSIVIKRSTKTVEPESENLIITEDHLKETCRDTFKSCLNEEWHYWNKKVYDDFFAENALQSNDFKLDTLFESHIITIRNVENFDEALSRIEKYKSLEALQIVSSEVDNTTFTKIIDVLKSKKYFKKLLITHCSISKIPENIVSLKNLETLDISSNRIKEISDNIGQLLNLKYLRISKNKSIKEIPESIGNLVNLELLNISSCSISKIPKSIENCKELISLTANNTNLRIVPKEIGNCKNLKHLNLGHNKIKSFPKEIGNLDKLETLSISYNLHDTIPEEFKNLKNLFHFN